jgi:hypothetical protein
MNVTQLTFYKYIKAKKLYLGKLILMCKKPQLNDNERTGSTNLVFKFYYF